MAEQQGNPKRSVALATLIALVALAGFAAAFYYLDGMTLVDELFGTTFAQETSGDDGSGGDQGSVEDPDDATLRLPDGMSEEFALRIWQEQIDSQRNIERLVKDEVERLVITNVERDDDAGEAVLDIEAQFRDGTSAPGKLGMRLLGDVWYFSYVSGMRDGETGGFADDTAAGAGDPPETPLPELDDVDIPLLNEMLAQQEASAPVLEEYADGRVFGVSVLEVVEGPGTATLKIEMDEDHETGVGEIVVISKEVDGKERWFVARFTKLEAE